MKKKLLFRRDIKLLGVVIAGYVITFFLVGSWYGGSLPFRLMIHGFMCFVVGSVCVLVFCFGYLAIHALIKRYGI